MLKFREIKAPGDIANERVILDVIENSNSTNFAIGKTVKLEKGIDAKLKSVFWFPAVPLAQGDVVVLYTKNGKDRERPNTRGSKSVFFYWRQAEGLWGDPKCACILLQLDDAKVFFPDEFVDLTDAEDGPAETT